MPGAQPTKTSQDAPPPFTPAVRTLPTTQPALPRPVTGLETEAGGLESLVDLRSSPFGGRVGLGRGRWPSVPRSRPSIADALTATYRGLLDPEFVVGPTDDRVMVKDTTVVPWRQVCALRISLKGGHQLSGTGWLIGKNTLITAGHCVFPHIHGLKTDPSFRYDDWVDRIEIYPGADGIGPNNKPRSLVTPAVSRRFAAPEGWWRTTDEEMDYGAIFVDDPPADWAGLGYFSFASYGDADLEGSTVNVSGYPSDKDQPGEVGRQFNCAQNIVHVTPRRLIYENDTYAGQSGSPVFMVLPAAGGTSKFTAVGIHNYGDRRGVANSGARITPDVFAQMKAWKSGRG